MVLWDWFPISFVWLHSFRHRAIFLYFNQTNSCTNLKGFTYFGKWKLGYGSLILKRREYERAQQTAKWRPRQVSSWMMHFSSRMQLQLILIQRVRWNYSWQGLLWHLSSSIGLDFPPMAQTQLLFGSRNQGTFMLMIRLSSLNQCKLWIDGPSNHNVLQSRPSSLGRTYMFVQPSTALRLRPSG